MGEGINNPNHVQNKGQVNKEEALKAGLGRAAVSLSGPCSCPDGCGWGRARPLWALGLVWVLKCWLCP